MKYIKVKDAAQRWGVSTRRVQDLCKQGRIPGAQLWERTWMLPVDAQYPAKEEHHIRMPMPRKTPFLIMTDLYHTPGTADASAAALAGQPEAQALFQAELAYYRGDLDAVYEKANYFFQEHSGFYAVIAAGMLLGHCAMWRGDIELWNKAKAHICEAPSQNETDESIVALSLAAVDMSIRNIGGFPEWFVKGRFSRLPSDAHPAAKVYYCMCLLIYYQEVALANKSQQGMSGLGLMKVLPNIIEPMITQAQVDKTLVVELYLRLMCAVAYLNTGDTAWAIEHIDAAIALALPDGLLAPFAEYRRQLGYLLDDRLTLVDPAATKQLKQLQKQLQQGWTQLHNAVLEKRVSASLSVREREVARLAAFGHSDQEIADQLGVSKSTVKSLISMAKNKTGTMKRSELAAYI